MICTLTLNPSLDCFFRTGKLVPGALNRADSCSIRPGGKGINVSAVLRELGTESTVLGFPAGSVGDLILDMIRRSGLDEDMIRIGSGESRINVKVSAEEETEINGTGPDIDERHIGELLDRTGRLGPGDMLIMSGSVPPSAGNGIYRQIEDRLAGTGALVVADTSGEPLRLLLPGRPFLVKPNRSELEELLGYGIQSRDDVIRGGRQLLQMGARNALISLGADGAVLVCGDEDIVAFADAPSGKVTGTVGAGDSMLAGFVHGYMISKDFIEALRYGVAAGSATAFSEGLATREATEALLPRIRIES